MPIHSCYFVKFINLKTIYKYTVKNLSYSFNHIKCKTIITYKLNSQGIIFKVPFRPVVCDLNFLSLRYSVKIFTTDLHTKR